MTASTGVEAATRPAGRKRRLSIRNVPIGPPMIPPVTMPTMAEATARVEAPFTPACSKSGAKARPVAGPPVSVTDPASTPSSGGTPRPAATAAPARFWRTATAVARARKTATAGPPERRSGTLAPKPIEVKNAIMSGACSVVSNVTAWWPEARRRVIPSATSSPPTTGAGML